MHSGMAGLQGVSDGRVATRVDPATQTREDAIFLSAGSSEIFCVIHRPAAAPVGGVVICPSIFTEELKIYGTQVLAARAFAAAGFAVARFHYRGTGHSSGVIADLTVDSMLNDTATVATALGARTGADGLSFCGGRFGGLIAALAALEYPRAPAILWEPTIDGRSYFRDVFRGSQLSALAGGASALTVAQAEERLRSGAVLDTLGYPIHGRLYESAAPRNLLHLAPGGPRPVLIIQISRRREVRPEFARVRAALSESGVAVEVMLIEGEGAWSFVDSPMPAPGAIVEASLAWLGRAAGVVGRGG